MKIKIEVDESINEDEVIIKCRDITSEVNSFYKKISNFLCEKNEIAFYKGEQVFYFPLSDVLFFETEYDRIYAHTTKDSFIVKFKLYQLENFLPMEFIRCSKSTIVNSSKIFSINKNITASSLIEFYNSHKQVYVSRFYYKALKLKLDERSK